jgi:hypothetical protein
LLHVATLLWMFVLSGVHRDSAVVVQEQPPRSYTLIYTPAESLLPMEDGGSQAAASRGTRGGREAFHRIQTIHIIRTVVVTPAVVEAPKLTLPQVPATAANLLAVPSPALPALKAPVEFAPQASKIPRPARAPEAKMAAADVSRLQLRAGNVRDVDSSALAAIEKFPVKSEVVLAPAPRPAMPRRTTVEVAAGTTTELQLAAVTPIPADPAGALDATPAAVPAPRQVVISPKPGDVVGAPADGTAGSLAMSPRAHAQAGLGGGKAGVGAARGAGPGSAPSGAGPSNSESASGGSTAAASGASLGSGQGASAPGVTVRGGVIALDSFGPKAVPGDKSAAGSASARKAAPITVIATSRSGGGLNAYGVFKNRIVYTVYLNAKGGQVVLQFAAQDASAASSTSLTPPDPISAELPPGLNGTSAVLACVLDATGHLQNLRSVQGETPQALEEAVRQWRFHPVLNGSQPVNVDALIGIGTGIR